MDAIVLVNWGCLAVTLVAEYVIRWRELLPSAQPNRALHPLAGSAAISGRGCAQRRWADLSQDDDGQLPMCYLR